MRAKSHDLETVSRVQTAMTASFQGCACEETAHAALDIVESILAERAVDGASPLRLDEVQRVIAQVKAQSGPLRKLCDEVEAHCSPEDRGQKPTLRAVGRLQTVGLRGVRDELGARWPDVAERVKATALAVIRRSLTSQDSFLCNSQGDYIICFGDLLDQEAWVKAKSIEQEICRRLLGSDEASALADFDFEIETLSDISELETETHDFELPPFDPEDDEAFGALVASKLDEAGEAIRARVQDYLKELEQSWTLEFREVHVASGAPARMLIAEADRATRMALSRLSGSARRDTELLARMDLLSLGAAAHHLGQENELGGALLAVEIHASTIMRRANLELFRGACQMIPDEVRGQLILVVGGLPRDAYAPAVADALRLLKGFSRVTALRLNAARLGRLDLRAAGVPLVVLSQSRAIAALNRAPEGFGRFLRELHQAGGRLLVDKVAKPESVEPLIEAGIELWSPAGS